MTSSNFRPAIEMVTSTMIWGFGFVATQWVLTSLDTISLTAARFSLAFFIGIIVLFVSGKKNQFNWHNFRISAVPGLLIGLMLVAQTWGLELTSVTNSGFITTLYVVFVPVIEFIFLRKRVRPISLVWVLLALLGTAFMVHLVSMNINRGDSLTLLCAILGAGQIVWVSRVRDQIESPFAFNAFQSAWAGVAALLCLPFYGHTYFHVPDQKAIWGFLSVTIGSTIIAFSLQIKAQKTISATTASLFFLFESPFATFFAIMILKDTVTSWQILGALCIFAAAIGSISTEAMGSRKA